ncbi:hypothetical protein MMC07_005012 [Pseudocyphellaria aurata]|nr:hypothetical protein [Pseudocyphellaria aurata]
MSGAEVALALLPLLISAVEHFNDCLRPITRYRKFTSELNRFQHLLKIQRTIFRNQCSILLENVVNQDAAKQMLEERNHLLWCDAETEKLLLDQLGSSREACIAVVELIDDKLRELEKECSRFETIIDHEYQTHMFASQTSWTRSSGDPPWRVRAAKKLRFSFSESRLEHSITHLRHWNDDFRALAEHENCSLEIPSRPTPAKTRSSAMVERYQSIGKASRQVYEALGRACTKHTEHLAHFNINVEYESPNELSDPRIKFHLAFTHIMLSGVVDPEDPVWLVVDSTQDVNTTDNKCQRAACLDGIGRSLKDELNRSLKRQLEPSPAQISKKLKGLDPVTTAPAMAVSNPSSTSFSTTPVQDFNKRRDFCDYLLRWSRQSSQANACVGILETPDCCRYLVYPRIPPVRPKKKLPTSLSQLLSSVSGKEPKLRILQYEKLCLAKSLAKAVLQYHATPWLKMSWRSKDILFFDRDEQCVPDGKLLLTEPHVNVKVNGPDEHHSPMSNLETRNIVRNPLLFGLGVVFIEIANSSTLRRLQLPLDLDDGEENQYTEYHLAKRLASCVGRELGASYGKIVNKLLFCDFGCGDDLNDRELQARFHTDVVCELDELERGFRSLQLE